MKTADQLIEHMKGKGVKFSLISEKEAKAHLCGHNNYFKLTAYRKNYTKTTTGVNAGKYENLEFAYLIELARLDTEVRHLLLQMALDIEHFLKVALIHAVEDRMASVGDEDGYEIVRGFLIADDVLSISERAEKATKRSSSFSRKITQNKRNPYCGGLIDSYSDEMPIWTFVELVSFGDLRDLIEYYTVKTGWQIPVDLKSIDRVRQLRNACAHGNCIINDLCPVSPTTSGKSGVSSAPLFITNFVKKAGVGTSSRQKKLSNPRINQIVHLLYVYDLVFTSKHTRNQRLTELQNLINVRFQEHTDYFKNNQILTSTYDFFQKIVGTLS